ncbi:metallophosphoesterase [Pedobacter sp. HMF7647]|uniref:Metallophosphoesterase n=1 Tax=Hufsiella arboris TaxID=2695275 RepID=A0A7K1Y5Y4_9SPHI|nr:metallophosphoesterase [Hufsiella arboris]MXV49821.1 metallophosphoesterase [Hufsiella arboris]
MGIRKILQRSFRNPVIKLSNRLSSHPVKRRVHGSLTRLYHSIINKPGGKGFVVNFSAEDKFIIFSDHHKGAKDGADDFKCSEHNFLSALDFYNKNGFTYVCLGDSEELWENTLLQVSRHNKKSFEAEKQFLERGAFIKIFGNHDLYWGNDPLAPVSLNLIYGQPVKISEGLILQTEINGSKLEIFLTHGHQGDSQSDGNWFSKWFVSTVWAPFQSYLRINPNTPANNNQLKTLHNRFMYEWSARYKNLVLITGHTHQPVFASLTHLEMLYRDLSAAKKANDSQLSKQLMKKIDLLTGQGDLIPDFPVYKPSYFNSGCCCYDDGDITGIEIADGNILLVKWKRVKGLAQREVLVQAALTDLLE